MAVAFTVAVLVPTVLLVASHGALGAAWGWTIGNTIAAVLALLASRLPERGSGEQVQTAAAAASADRVDSRLTRRSQARRATGYLDA